MRSQKPEPRTRTQNAERRTPNAERVTRIQTYASFVRFSQSVFALPFALAGALLAAQHTPVTLAHVTGVCCRSPWPARCSRRSPRR